uniref:Uncharacterized protein n=1 Tax=Arundo donax TaxID=35708 RepID=A0A0A9HS69_ARUDO
MHHHYNFHRLKSETDRVSISYSLTCWLVLLIYRVQPENYSYFLSIGGGAVGYGGVP